MCNISDSDCYHSFSVTLKFFYHFIFVIYTYVFHIISFPHYKSHQNFSQWLLLFVYRLGQFTRNYTQTVKRAADNKRRYAPGKGNIPPILLSGVSKGACPLAHDFFYQNAILGLSRLDYPLAKIGRTVNGGAFYMRRSS